MKTAMKSMLILAGLLSFPVYARDYYVSSKNVGRSDANAGTSPTAPWATFGKVISSWGSLTAGDTVHVERGSQWDLSFSSDYFNITKGGSATGGHITLRGDDYGTGNKPILRRTGGSGDCAFITIKRSYVTVRDLELDGGHSNYGKNTGGMLIIADGSDLSNAQILNMRVRNLGGNSSAYVCGIWLASFSANTVSDCLIDGNEVSDYSAHGLNHYSPGPKINIIWRNNYVHNSFTGGRYPSANSAFQIGSYNNGCIFEHNWLEDTTTTEGCILGFGKYTHDIGKSIIRFNVIANSSTFGILYTIDHTNIRLNYDIYGNILINNVRSGIAIHPYNSYASGTIFNIFNNTFYNNCTGGGDGNRGDMEIESQCANTAIDFANNLVFHRNYSSTVGLVVKSGFNGSFSHRNNLYWHEGGTAKNIITHNQAYTVANAKTYESTAQNTNPQFKNTAQPPTAVSYATGPVPDGLSIQSTSPAIGAGANLGSAYALDINRVARTAPWTIGAYQSGSAPSSDTTAPTVSVTAPTNGTVVSGIAATVSASASDNIGVTGVQFKLDGANLGAEAAISPYLTAWDTTGTANGLHSLTAVARDAAGNTKTSAVVSVTVSNVPLPADAIVSASTAWQTRSFALQNGMFSAEFDAVPSTVNMDGIIGLSRGGATDYENLAVIVRFNTSGQIDVRNGDSYAATAQVSYAPGIKCHFRILVNVPAHTYSVYVQVGVNPEVRIADNYAFRTSQRAVTGLDTFAVTSVIGIHTVSGFSVASAAPADTTPPTVSITAPVSGAIVSGSATTVSAGASDNIGVTGVQFKLDGVNLGAEDTVSPFSIVWNTTGASGGVHSLTAVARDAAGNIQTSAGVSVTVDNTAPTVSVTAPVGGAIVSGSALTVSAAATDNIGVTGVQFKLDGANLGTNDTTAPFSTVWNTTAASNGSHSLTAVARDAAGNSKTSAVVTVTVDNAAPTVSITAPANNAVVSGSARTVTASASDNLAVTGVQFKLDDANLNAEDTVSPYSIAWNTTVATNGSHSLTAVARDAAGNSKTSAVITVTVSNALPTVSISAPANGTVVSGSALTVSASASGGIGMAGVQFRLDGSNLGAEDTTSPFSTVWNTTGSANGSHSLTAVARDTAGNTKTSAAVSVTVSNAPPPQAAITSTAAWQNQSFASQSGQFLAEFDSVPAGAAIDAVTGISLGNAAGYDDLAVAVRFNPSGRIDARNGDTYSADAPVGYTTGTNYHFKLLINIPSHLFNVYVRSGTGPEVLLGSNYAFRTSQSAVTNLNNLAVTAVAGSHTVSGFTVTPIIVSIPEPPSGLRVVP